jgi:glycerol-3-phosphate dehydrogenase
LGDATAVSDLGEDFGATLHAQEIDWLMRHEYAHSAEDVVWRRSKLGLRLSSEQIAAIDTYMRVATGHA